MEAVRIKCNACDYVTDFIEGESLEIIEARELISCKICDSKDLEILQEEETVE